MKLGTVEIDNPVRREVVAATDPDRKKLFKHLEHTDIANEKDFLRQLKLTEFVANRCVRKIDVGFLSKSKKIKHEGFVGVPVFGVFKYAVAERRFMPCGIMVRDGRIGTSGINKVFGQALYKACKMKDGAGASMPFPGGSQVAAIPRGLTATQYMQDMAAAMAPMGSFVGERYGNPWPSSPSYDLSASFSGVLPTNTKRILKEAVECFDEVNIIAEADWEIKRVRLEPFLVGVHKDEVFLLDHFDTSNLEKYVLSEFLI